MSNHHGQQSVTSQGQVNYVLGWFREWSEMQKDDFLPIIAQKYAPSSYVNGLVEDLQTMKMDGGRPPSLFKCQIKLFDEWFDGWSEAERGAFVEQLKEIDGEFISRFESEISKPQQQAVPLQEDEDE